MGRRSNKQSSAQPQSFCQAVAKQNNSLPGHSVGKNAIRSKDARIRLGILDLLDALPFYVLVVDENHCVLEANSAVYTHLGVKREDILGEYCPKIIHGLEEPFPGCPLEEAVKNNQAVERELLDQETGRWVVSAVYPIRDLRRDNKKIFLHTVTDVTVRKQAQQQLKDSHEQLRILSAHLESVREEEKKEIARDLHDETSQLLSSLYAHLEAAIVTLPEDASKTETLIRKAQTLSITILDEIHKLIYELRPAELDELGLMAAISSLVDSHVKMAGVKVSLKTTGKVRRLPSSLEIALFRVIQEALNNIVKHAHASKTDVSVHFKKYSIKVRVKDDGIGFDVQEAMSSKDRPRGLGLLGMRERVELINGSLVIKSSPGCGTEITTDVLLPGGTTDG